MSNPVPDRLHWRSDAHLRTPEEKPDLLVECEHCHRAIPESSRFECRSCEERFCAACECEDGRRHRICKECVYPGYSEWQRRMTGEAHCLDLVADAIRKGFDKEPVLARIEMAIRRMRSFR